MLTIVLSQIVWCLLVFADLSVGVFLAVLVPLLLIELAGPILAETRYGGTPWHPHHIAERYGLMVIITLGEGLLGTIIALRTVIEDGWSVDMAVLGFAGTAMIFGLWWTYFVIPHGHLLRPIASAGSPGATATCFSSEPWSASAPACTWRRTTSARSTTSA